MGLHEHMENMGGLGRGGIGVLKGDLECTDSGESNELGMVVIGVLEGV